MMRRIDELVDSMFAHYMRLTGMVPSFSDYVQARECAARELRTELHNEGVSSEGGRASLPDTPPASSPRVASGSSAARSEGSKKLPDMSGKSASARHGISSTKPMPVVMDVKKEYKSDFDILRSVKDEWN